MGTSACSRFALNMFDMNVGKGNWEYMRVCSIGGFVSALKINEKFARFPASHRASSRLCKLINKLTVGSGAIV